jgi:nucleotide-binding universal stress UspA family protein
MKILIAYDGSADAKAAVSLVGRLFDGSTAVVLNVWEGFSEVVTRAGEGLASSLDFEHIDAACEQAAWECAEEGTAHARAAGLPAEARIAKRSATTWEAIAAQADEVDADMIVVGRRGLSGVKSLLLGSVSRALLQRAGLPVLVVPLSATVAERIARRSHHETQEDSDFFSARL